MACTKKLFFLIAAFAALFMTACESSGPTQSTSVNRVLAAPDRANAPYSKILVIAALPSRETARSFEIGLLEELKSTKLEAHSFVRESSSREPTEDAIRELVAETGATGVLVLRGELAGATITEKDEQVDLEADARAGATAQGGSLFGYFRYDYKNVSRPSYADYVVDVTLVSDFYDVASGDRIYSLESSTADGGTTYDIVKAESKAIVKRLRQDNIIR